MIINNGMQILAMDDCIGIITLIINVVNITR